jgi:hypothetical protein
MGLSSLMNPDRRFQSLALAGLALSITPCLVGKNAELEPQVFQLDAFVVYSGNIDVIDGFTGDVYHESNTVVDEFRQDFNKLLNGYHKQLLLDEYQHMEEQLALAKRFEIEIQALAEGFNIRGFSINHASHMKVERAIMDRLIKDPFFQIEAVVVWDLEKLKGREDRKPLSLFARDIRYDPEKGRWERRITTRWRVNYYHQKTGAVDVLKEQGLNLDTQEGFHFINRNLGNEVPPGAFRPVKLTYPIFINSGERVDAQAMQLKEELVSTLYHIYDPFSWAWRRNVRFSKGYFWPIQMAVRDTRFKVKQRSWFEEVMVHFLSDISTMRIKGVNQIYEQEMLTKIPVNSNILGTGFDLLNWNEGENRSVYYNPKENRKVRIDFNKPEGARFNLIYAYRRYSDKLVLAFQQKLASQKRATLTGQELIREVLGEVSGFPADTYIRAATKAQVAELEKYRYQL